ncbi:MAG: hypothetical protein MUO31_13165 [Thermodesulfovibrionales bacterium]|nr:hypothetical protein [Thermodesulfovibrionales bacterium]
MTHVEADLFIEKVLKAYYPRWNPKDEEFEGWVRRLVYYDYEQARKAVESLFFESKVRTIEPPAGKVMAIIKSTTKVAVKDVPLIQTNLFVECIEAPERNLNLKGAKKGVFAADKQGQDDYDYLLRCAEVMKIKHQELYGGVWIIVHAPKQEPNSGLRGEQARDKAFADILNGPDSTTRRWLEKYLEKQYTAKMLPDMKSVPSARVNVSNRRNEQIKKLANQ